MHQAGRSAVLLVQQVAHNRVLMFGSLGDFIHMDKHSTVIIVVGLDL